MSRAGFWPAFDALRADPAASRWLREALDAAMERDPLDAARDARMLADLLDARACEALAHALDMLP